MKKTAVILISLVCILTLAACGGGHTHEFSEAYTHDGTYHWLTCTGEGCDATDGKAEHTLDGGEATDEGIKYTCTVCGAEKLDAGSNGVLPENISDILSEATRSSVFNNVTIVGEFKGESCELRLDRDPNNETLQSIITELRAIDDKEIVDCTADGENASLTVRDADGVEWQIEISEGRIVSYVGDDTSLTFSDYGTTVGYGVSVGKLCAPVNISLLDGGSVSTADYAGQVIVINFWGTWCAPCKSELPDFNAVASEYADTVRIVTVHSVDGLENAQEYVSTHFPDSKMIFGHDERGEDVFDKLYTYFDFYGAYPATLVINTEGVIVYKATGVISHDALKSVIDEALAE